MQRFAGLICLLGCFFSIQIFGADSMVGHWEGVIAREGKEWRVWLDTQNDGDKFKGTIDFPDFGLYALPANLVTVSA